jgi:hypothetical protein
MNDEDGVLAGDSQNFIKLIKNRVVIGVLDALRADGHRPSNPPSLAVQHSPGSEEMFDLATLWNGCHREDVGVSVVEVFERRLTRNLPRQRKQVR